MANDDYREQHQAARAAGLEARHETRVERAIRRQVAGEVEAVIKNLIGPTGADCTCEGCRVLRICLDRVREIGAKGDSDATRA